MNCGQAEKWMDAALDELSGGEYHAPRGWSEQRRAELEAHFGLCSACRSQWDLLRSAEIALRVPKPVTAPDSLLLEFRQRLAAEAAPAPRRMPAERPRSPWAWIWPLGSVAAAGAAAATVLMFNVYVAPVPTPTPPPEPLSDAATPELFGRPEPRFSRAEDQVRELKPRATSKLAAKPALRVGPPALAASGTPAPLASLDSHVEALAAPHASTAASDLAVKPEKKSADQPAVSHVASAAATPVNATLSLKQLTQTQAPPAAAPSAANGQFNRNLYRYQLGSKMQVASDRLSLLKEKEAAGQATLALGIVPPDGAYYSRPSQNWALYGTDAAQVAAFRVSQNANLSYTQVSLEPMPVELNVSSAVLNALQRPVEVQTSNGPVEEVAQQLARSADVVVKVDPALALTHVMLSEENAPLWQVLEKVARQSDMEVLPQENTLCLRRIGSRFGALVMAEAPAGAAGAGVVVSPEYEGMRRKQDQPRAKREAASTANGARGAVATPRADPAAPARMAKAVQPSPVPMSRGIAPGGRDFGADRLERHPDRKVWPAAWGNLPERGFETPSAEELPPLVLAPIVMDTGFQVVPQVRGRSKRPVPAAKPVRTRK